MTAVTHKLSILLAERVGFEPTVESPLHFLSRETLSTTQSTFQNGGHEGN